MKYRVESGQGHKIKKKTVDRNCFQNLALLDKTFVAVTKQLVASRGPAVSVLRVAGSIATRKI